MVTLTLQSEEELLGQDTEGMDHETRRVLRGQGQRKETLSAMDE